MGRQFATNPLVRGNASAALELVPKQQLDAAIATVAPKLLSVSSKVANYTLTDADDVVIFDCSAAIRTATLPTAVGRAGKMFTIKKKGPVDSFYVQLATTSGETIDGGSASLHIIVNTDAKRYISDGTAWHTLGVQSFLTIYTSPANGGALTIDSPAQQIARVSTTVAGFTLNPPANPLDGMNLNVEIVATNAFSLIINASIKLTTGLATPIAVPAGKTLFLGLRRSDTAWRLLAATVDQ